MAQNVVCEVWRNEQWVPETIAEALEKRSQGVHERRRCTGCHDETLVAYKEGRNGQPAHFEHRPWNKRCPLRDQTWEEERLAWEILENGGMLREDAKTVVEQLQRKAKTKGTTFGTISKRAQAVHMNRQDFLEHFERDLDGLILEIEGLEQQG
jgi:polyhydroxyalkanoate synthesis regulator phasin